MFKIKKLTPQNIAQFHKLFITVLENGFENYSPQGRDYIARTWRKSQIAKKLPQSKYLFLIAQDKDTLAGYLIAKHYPRHQSSTILWLGILNAYRGQGLGTKLVREWEKWGRQLKVRKLRLSTSNFNNENFYTKLGYKKYPKIVKNDWGMSKLVFYKKFRN